MVDTASIRDALAAFLFERLARDLEEQQRACYLPEFGCDLSRFRKFAKNTPEFRQRVAQLLVKQLRELEELGAKLPPYKVICDESNNSVEDIAAGKVVVTIASPEEECSSAWGERPREHRCPDCCDEPEGDGGARRYSYCVCPPPDKGER